MWFKDKNAFVGKRMRTSADSRELLELHRFLAESFAVRAESRNGSKKAHIKRVEQFTGILVRAMLASDYPDFTAEYGDNIVLASTLHDIGKIAVNDEILLKANLNEKESRILQEHTLRGEEILSEISKKLGGGTYIEAARIIAKFHHERFNGCGYPDRLKGEEIPLPARIVSVALGFEGFLNSGLSADESASAMREFAGVYYDGALTDLFLSRMNEIENVIKEVK